MLFLTPLFLSVRFTLRRSCLASAPRCTAPPSTLASLHALSRHPNRNGERLQEGGFRHHELYFPDGSCPSEAILMRFLELAEAEPGVVCIHCKAGLGRTGVLICCYIMKHYRFTANEAIGYV